MKQLRHDIIRRLHDSPKRIALVTTGGGSRAISDVVSTPGASSTVIEATVPYSPESLHEYISHVPDQYCSERTARSMAMAAFWRAAKLNDALLDAGQEPTDVHDLVGVSCTASLASDRPKRGEHRLHLALQTSTLTKSLSVTLDKDARSRDEEEELAANLITHLLGMTLKSDDAEFPSGDTTGLTTSDKLDQRAAVAVEDWSDLLLGAIDATFAESPSVADSESPAAILEVDDVEEQEVIHADAPVAGALFPGAFNPWHDGHQLMTKIASDILEQDVEHEISIENVDKLPLDFLDLKTRTAQFATTEGVWLTRAPTFVEKAKLFPGVTFIVGADTISRIADPKYYGNSEANRDAAVRELDDWGARFLVFGRTETHGSDSPFMTIAQLNLPAALAQLCAEVPEEKFRSDISSTALRRSAEL